jgi:hypothetical protein
MEIYTASEVRDLLGKMAFDSLRNQKKLVPIARNTYPADKVLEFKADLDERRKIPPANWIKKGVSGY